MRQQAVFYWIGFLKHLEEVIQSNIILLDIMLPGVNGFQIFEKIKENYPKVASKVLF